MRRLSTLFFLSCFLYVGNTCAQGWQWARGSRGGYIEGWLAATDKSGNIYAAGIEEGASSSTLYIFGTDTIRATPTSRYNACAIITKYDASGNFRWARSICNATPTCIKTDLDGNVVLLGVFDSSYIEIYPDTLINENSEQGKYFLAKFDSSGNILWLKNAGNRSTYIGYPLPNSAIIIDNSKNIYFTGTFHKKTDTVGSVILTNSDVSGITDDVKLIKFDPAGNILWGKSAGGKGDDKAGAITITNAGNIYIAGEYRSASVKFGSSEITHNAPNERDYIFIAEYDSTGVPLWAEGSTGTDMNYQLVSGLVTDENQSIYLLGSFTDSIMLFNGDTIVNPVPPRVSLFLLKLDADNTFSWYKTIFSVSKKNVWGYGIAYSPCRNIWISGTMGNGNVNIDGNILNGPPGEHFGDLIAGYTPAGILADYAKLEQGGDDMNGIACDTDGNVFLSSDYEQGTFTVGPDTLPPPWENGATEWLYIAKYASAKTVVPADTVIKHTKAKLCLLPDGKLQAPKGYSAYLWSDGSNGTSLPISEAGTYWVLGTGPSNTAVIDTFIVSDKLCDCSAFLPNAFTPNNDGKNDNFKPYIPPFCNATGYIFTVYNRWGQQVFKSSDPTNGWDGTFNGVPQELDTYMYLLEYISGSNALKHNIKGDVILIR